MEKEIYGLGEFKEMNKEQLKEEIYRLRLLEEIFTLKISLIQKSSELLRLEELR